MSINTTKQLHLQFAETEPRKMTNREWLESLSDEEFVKFMESSNMSCTYCIINKDECYSASCLEGRMNWLKAEHKEVSESC